jgi:hypothetical protein
MRIVRTVRSRMKKAIIFLVSAVITLCLIGIFLHHGPRVHAMRTPINTKDLREHGLTLIGPSDSSFEDNVSAILRSGSNQVVDAIKPFSVIVKNANQKAVVAYRLKWEMVRQDGTLVNREAGGANPGALMDGGPDAAQQVSRTAGYAIPSNSRRLVSTGFSLGEGQGMVGSHAGGSSNPDDLPRLLEAVRRKDVAAVINITNSELESYKSITVSIDGAFFEDGSYVGPDTTDFFAKLQAILDAKRDLLQEISFRHTRSASPQEIFDYVGEIANGPDVPLRDDASTTDHYNFYKKVFAGEVVRTRQTLGDEKAVAAVLQPLRKPWPRLRKL